MHRWRHSAECGAQTNQGQQQERKHRLYVCSCLCVSWWSWGFLYSFSSVTSLTWGQVTSSWESDGEEDLGTYFNVHSYFLSYGSFLFTYCNDFLSLLLVAFCHLHGRRKHKHRFGIGEPFEGVEDSLEFCLRVVRSWAGALKWGSDELLRSWLNGGGGYSSNLHALSEEAAGLE